MAKYNPDKFIIANVFDPQVETAINAIMKQLAPGIKFNFSRNFLTQLAKAGYEVTPINKDQS